MNISLNRQLSRRTFLRGAGITLALPFLDAMRPVFGAAAAVAKPRRMVCIQTNMGIMPQFFSRRRQARITRRRRISNGSRRIADSSRCSAA